MKCAHAYQQQVPHRFIPAIVGNLRIQAEGSLAELVS